MNIVLFGTPEFAVPVLNSIVIAGHTLAAVVAQPDQPVGRGGRIEEPPVKRRARELGVPTLQFEKVRRKESLERLRSIGADAFVTAAYGQILSERLLAIPALGTVNVHASLLPAYRGAAPAQWAIINGETRTGVTTMLTDKGVDTGDILLQRETAIDPNETAGQLLERLSHMGAELLVETLDRIERGTCPRLKQDESAASHIPMLNKSHGVIDWTEAARRVRDRIRGVSPWPGAVTYMQGGALKIWSANILNEESREEPGTVILADAKRGLAVACGVGALELTEIQPPGGKRMDARAYLRGRQIPLGIKLGGG